MYKFLNKSLNSDLLIEYAIDDGSLGNTLILTPIRDIFSLN
jgi:hypothetical protein